MCFNDQAPHFLKRSAVGQTAVPQELPCFLLWDRAAKSIFLPHNPFFLASFPLLTTEFGLG